MATWKELRALQAAARAAEAQRQTETARGQREARGLERTLGLVDQLIGLAPQAIEGYQAGEVQKILAGERGLEREKPKDDDILGQIGAFIASPFEEGVQRKAKMAAGRMAPERLQQVEPLLREAIRKPGMTPAMTPQEVKKQVTESKAVGGKFVEPAPRQRAPREAARAELMKDPALALLPQQQQEAAIAGLEQRMAAEQGAAQAASAKADLERRKAEADIALKEAEAGDLKLKGTQEKAVDLISAPLFEVASSVALSEKEGLTSTDVNRVLESRRNVLQAMDDQLVALGQDPSSPSAQEAKQRALKAALKDTEMPDLPAGEITKLSNLSDTIRNLMTLDALRQKAEWNPKKAQIIKQKIVESFPGTPIVDAGDLLRLATNTQNRAKLSADELAFLNYANIMQNRMALAEFVGTGAVGEKEANRVMPFVLNPWTTDVEWEKEFSTSLQGIAGKFGHTVLAQRELNRVPESLVSLARDAIDFSTTTTRPDAISRALQKSKEIMESPADTTRPTPEQAALDIQKGGRAALGAPGEVIGETIGLEQFLDRVIEANAADAPPGTVDYLKSLLKKLPAAPAPAAPAPAATAPAAPAATAPAEQKVTVRVTAPDGQVKVYSTTRSRLDSSRAGIEGRGFTIEELP